METTDPARATRVAVPREVVLASAGTGKTFRLSSRIIALLNAGARPGEVLASTFTRKAAGEILERVLLRLARAQESDEALDELIEHGSLHGAPAIDRERAGEILADLVDQLHRANVSTLDAFLHRVAGAFALEIGLPPGWTVADAAEEEALVTAAVDLLLERADQGELVELLRMYRSGEVARGVHGELTRIVGGLQKLHRSLDPGVAEPWGIPSEGASPPTPEELAALADRLVQVDVPRNQDGSASKRWKKALLAHASCVRERDWEGVLGRGPFANLLAGDPTYYGAPIPEPIRALFDPAKELARRDLRPALRDRGRALGRLACHFEDAFDEAQRARGSYRFEDVPHLLLRTGATGRGSELYYRLDGRIRHLLLDEFQDTSVLQWWALLPLIDEILQDPEGERAVVVVADPKQSIYGWRGGEPELLRAVEERSGILLETLDESYRSAGPVLDAVNRIFAELPASEALNGVQAEVARQWMTAFPVHRPAFPERVGYVRVVEGPEENHRRQVRHGLLDVAVGQVLEIRTEAPGASVGVLCRTREAVTGMIHRLREAGVEVSEEGGSPVTDAWPVHLILAALRLADHPGDVLARYVVGYSSLGSVLGLAEDAGDPDAARVSHRIRSELVARGYGPVLDDWVRGLRSESAPRDRHRLDQLVELAFAFDQRGGSLRPQRFLEAVERTAVEAPGEARVRVMTIHAAKGLEFDAVVLPDLERPLSPGRGEHGPLPIRERAGGAITRIYPYVPRTLQPLFPDIQAADRVRRGSEFRDELGGLYVALTRARHAMYLLVERGREDASTPARLIREGLACGEDRTSVPDSEAAGDGTVIAEIGQPDWAAAEGKARPGDERPEPEPPPGPLVWASPTTPRGLPRVTPSELEGGEGRRMADLLRPRNREALQRGTLVHAWLEAVTWIEDGLPARERFLTLAAERAPAISEPEALLDRFLGWLEEPPIRRLLSRSEFPAGTRVEREVPFLARDGDRLVEGIADRVLRIPPADDGVSPRLVVIDWKTDHPEDSVSLEERVRYYRPQVEAYVRAIAASEGLPPERATGVLAFLSAGAVRSVGGSARRDEG